MLTDQLVRTRPLSPFETEPSVCLDVSFPRSLVRTCLSGNGPKRPFAAEATQPDFRSAHWSVRRFTA